jgi:hypothetical protein
MGALINFLVLMTLFFAGMAQSGSMNKQLAYSIAGGAAAVALVLAAIRYKQRKDRGE